LWLVFGLYGPRDGPSFRNWATSLRFAALTYDCAQTSPLGTTPSGHLLKCFRMRILGIDPGYDRCGFGVVDVVRGKATAVAFGIITTSKGEMPERLREIAADFSGLLSKHKPEVLSIEDLYFAKSVTTALKVAEVRGVVMMPLPSRRCRSFR
jgi:hypothetical protein